MHNNSIKLSLNGLVSVFLLLMIWIPAIRVNKDSGSVRTTGSGLSSKFADNINDTGQQVLKELSESFPIKVIVPNNDRDSFYVDLKDTLIVEQSIYDSTSKIIAISDIEGNFNALYGFLISNKIIDKNYEWIFGNGRLVFVGDFVDRGHETTEVLWFIYKLEQEAMKYGGKVHYILGNHEVLNIQRLGFGQYRYKKNDFIIKEEVYFDKSNKFIFSKKSELGKWLRTKNSIEKIGNYIFVHGGISPRLLSYKQDIDKINNTFRKFIEHDLYNEPGNNEFANFVLGKEGPIWFRGLAMAYKYYNKVNPSEFRKIANYFNASRIVIGHTVVEDIMTDFGGSLIKIDVIQGKEKFTGRTRGILIENNKEFKIDDKGNKWPL
jgi:hypothetical protein